MKKNIAYKYEIPFWALIIVLVLLGLLLWSSIYIGNIFYMIFASAFMAIILVEFIYIMFLRKTILLSCDDDGIIIHHLFGDKRFMWHETGHIDFKRAYTRSPLIVPSHGTLKISVAGNKVVRIFGVSNVKTAYDNLVEAKNEHYNK